jgi:phosphatidylserine/phosphatidylglycerophosphate/cardiolipin synthase-like enzyme
VIESAKKRLFMVSFVAYEVTSIGKALKDASERHVRIDVLLESSIERGGKVTTDSVKTMKDVVPSVNVYVWHAATHDLHKSSLIGSVHAKCAVSDGELAFITSANLSGAAMERNMELGILVRGGHLPEQLHRHLESLVTTGIVERA